MYKTVGWREGVQTVGWGESVRKCRGGGDRKGSNTKSRLGRSRAYKADVQII